MFRYSIVLLCAVLVLSNVEFIKAGKYGGGGGSRHSYPRSGGLSGGGHSYPGGGSHSGGSHSYPGSGGSSHNYPSSGGLSGNNRGGGYSGTGGHNYPNSGGNKYPTGNTGSGSHSYPNSGSGLSGNNHGNAGRGPSGGTTNIHHHYHYNPPQQIHYASPHGGPAMNYPVYRGTPPTYVYQYKDSGSKYGTLLAGLALFNLGALAGGAYGYSQGHHSSSQNSYRAQPGEVCIFGIKKDNGDFEETKIDCQLISSFIYAEQAKQQSAQNQTTVTTTVMNTTVVNTTNAQETPTYVLAANGTLILSPDAVNNTNSNVTSAGVPAPGAGGTVTSSVTVTTVNTTVVNALDVKGKPIDVTPGMQCYVMRKTSSSRMKKDVPCGLLQTYADKSIKPNSAARNVPAFTILAVVCAVFVAN